MFVVYVHTCSSEGKQTEWFWLLTCEFRKRNSKQPTGSQSTSIQTWQAEDMDAETRVWNQGLLLTSDQLPSPSLHTTSILSIC